MTTDPTKPEALIAEALRFADGIMPDGMRQRFLSLIDALQASRAECEHFRSIAKGSSDVLIHLSTAEKKNNELRQTIARLEKELAEAETALCSMGDMINYIQRAEAAERRAERLEAAIRRALADEESGNGWGPDVTVCSYLREALSAPPGATP